IAYHFPPQSGSSGLLRSLKFTRYLLDFGWLSFVLSAKETAYERVDSQQLSEIPASVSVCRAYALDTKKHLSVGASYPRWFGLPDRWVSWCFFGVPLGLASLYRHRIQVIFTTFPVATAVLIGLILQRLSGKPWVVDFRDSMTEDDYPPDPLTRRVCRWIEK